MVSLRERLKEGLRVSSMGHELVDLMEIRFEHVMVSWRKILKADQKVFQKVQNSALLTDCYLE
jgi:hypothetical protein